MKEWVAQAGKIEEEHWQGEICQQEKVKISLVRAMFGGNFVDSVPISIFMMPGSYIKYIIFFWTDNRSLEHY